MQANDWHYFFLFLIISTLKDKKQLELLAFIFSPYMSPIFRDVLVFLPESSPFQLG